MEARIKEAETLFSQGRTAEAEDILNQLSQDENSRIKAVNYLGIIRQSQGREKEAEDFFRQALELAPTDSEIRGNLAFNLIGQKMWAEAKEHLQKLLAVNQNEAKLWALLAKAEQGLGQTRAVLDYLDRSLLLNPDQPDLQKARDRIAQGEQCTSPEPSVGKPSLLMCCQKSLESFANDLCDALEKKARIQRVVADNLAAFQWPLKSATTVWLEWGSQMAIAATKEPGLLADKKKVILRLHSFEILNGQAGEINYDVVTDVIFVSHYMRHLFNRRFPGRLARQRVHVIHNGIDLKRFPFAPSGQRAKIAFVGQLNYKKDPMVMLHAFSFLRQRHPHLQLHVAGGPDNDRYYLTMPDFLTKNSFQPDVAHFYGHIKDIPAWLADKDYILCTSPFESQGVGLLEAMHRGLRPLIYNFPGAEELYPRQFLWNNFDELEKMLLTGPEPEESSRFVADKYSMDRQAANFFKVVTSNEIVVEEPPVQPASIHEGK